MFANACVCNTYTSNDFREYYKTPDTHFTRIQGRIGGALSALYGVLPTRALDACIGLMDGRRRKVREWLCGMEREERKKKIVNPRISF